MLTVTMRLRVLFPYRLIGTLYRFHISKTATDFFEDQLINTTSVRNCKLIVTWSRFHTAPKTQHADVLAVVKTLDLNSTLQG